MKPKPVTALITHRVFLPARRETDRLEAFRRRWYRISAATNFTEPK